MRANAYGTVVKRFPLFLHFLYGKISVARLTFRYRVISDKQGSVITKHYCISILRQSFHSRAIIRRGKAALQEWKSCPQRKLFSSLQSAHEICSGQILDSSPRQTRILEPPTDGKQSTTIYVSSPKHWLRSKQKQRQLDG
jgi:hypothetical protein